MAGFDQIQSLGGPEPQKDNNPSLTELVDELTAQFSAVNEFYIRAVAEQIKVIGEMNPTSIERMKILARMNANIAEIRKRLQQALRYTDEQMDTLLTTAYGQVQESPAFSRILTDQPLSETAVRSIEQLALSIARQTHNTMVNLSNTTGIFRDYANTIDKALLAVTTGLDSHQAALRNVIRELGTNGMQVYYPSGYHRRLDSAVRANLVSAANQIAQQGSDIVKEDLGMNAVELTAHLAPAPDHAPVQGRVFLNEEFQKMQAGQDFKGVDGKTYKGFRRPIGEWNCMHMALGFDTRYSVRKWNDAQLKKILVDNQKGCTIDGKHLTLYEANQKMRRIETEIRRQKDVAVAADAANDIDLQKSAQAKIDQLGEVYLDVAETAGINPRFDRLGVNGFKQYKEKKLKVEDDWFNVNKDSIFSGLNRKAFKGVTGGLKTKDVYISSKQKQHIQQRHPEAYITVMSNLRDSLRAPDIVLRDKKHPENSCLAIKYIDEVSGTNTVVRIATEDDRNDLLNSVISGWKISGKRIEKLQANLEVLYKKNR